MPTASSAASMGPSVACSNQVTAGSRSSRSPPTVPGCSNNLAFGRPGLLDGQQQLECRSPVPRFTGIHQDLQAPAATLLVVLHHGMHRGRGQIAQKVTATALRSALQVQLPAAGSPSPHRGGFPAPRAARYRPPPSRPRPHGWFSPGISQRYGCRVYPLISHVQSGTRQRRQTTVDPR